MTSIAMGDNTKFTVGSGREDYKKKLLQMYLDNPLGFVFLLAFLDKSEKNCAKCEQGSTSQFDKILQIAYGQADQSVFKHYADKMFEDAEKCQTDPEFRAAMEDIYKIMAEANDGKNKEIIDNTKEHSGKDLQGSQKFAKEKTYSTEIKLYELDERKKSKSALSPTSSTVSRLDTKGGQIALAGLAAVTMTYKCYESIKLWLQGSISGKECAKVCVESIFTIGAEVAAGLAGATVGTVLLPGFGTYIGYTVGAFAGGQFAKAIIDEFTDSFEEMLDSPTEKAVENAYNYLGVQPSASNEEVNKAYRQKALRLHPDKGGKKEAFHKLQVHMSVIKISRGETSPN